MAKHILQLEVPNTSNEGVFLIDDISIYDTVLPVSCLNIQILPPGFNVPSSIGGMTAGFRLVLNACSMGMVTASNCTNSCPQLPDGVYHIRYSVAPNATVFVEYDVLRTTIAINRLNTILCNANIQCCLPDQETLYIINQCDLIRNFLLTAKLLVENQHNIADGVSMYRFAVSLIDKMEARRPTRCQI
jgi:hypothetical protein